MLRCTNAGTQSKEKYQNFELLCIRLQSRVSLENNQTEHRNFGKLVDLLMYKGCTLNYKFWPESPILNYTLASLVRIHDRSSTVPLVFTATTHYYRTSKSFQGEPTEMEISE